MSNKVCAIIGFGPGLGAAYASVFQEAGYDLALLSRSGAGSDALGAIEAKVKAYAVDAGDPEDLIAALEAAESDLGEIGVVIYNAGLATFGPLEEISAEQFEQSWRVGALGLFAAAKQLAPKMIKRRSGTILVSGATAALRGNVWTTAFAPSKSAQRNLAQSLAKQLGPKGIHVAYMIIDGVIDTADTRQGFALGKPDDFFIKPEEIAKLEAALKGD